MEKTNERRLKNSRYITGFDGIRTLAVIGVIVYHLLPYRLQGGYLGVPIFFVVSGYLITDLLLQEYEQNRRIDLVGFYERRLKRLYPALVAMVLATAAYITLFQRSLLTGLKDIIWTNFLYIYNWWEIGHGQSYFDRFNGESPFTHLWSLSIEGQFYFIWPLLLIGLLALFKQRKQIFQILLSLAILSGILMAALTIGGASSNRVYYGTDTRLFAVLFGVALAFVWPATKLKPVISQRLRFTLNGVGVASLIIIIAMFFLMSGQSRFTYVGGMFLFTIFSTILVATIAHPGADMNRLFSNPVFSWVGKRSYGIYLYQFPIMIFYEAKMTNIAAHPLFHAAIEVILILVASDLSYRYLEGPLRKYHYRHIGTSIRRFVKKQSPYGWKRLWLVPAILILIVAMTGAVTKPSRANQGDLALQKKIATNTKAANARNKAIKKKQAESKSSSQATEKLESKKTASLTGEEKAIATDYQLSKTELDKAKVMKVTAVGDSILADNSADLQRIFPQMIISAKVGRQIWDAPDVIKGLAAKGQLNDTVLINLGTNSPMSDDQLDDVMKAIGPKRHVYWINTHVPTRNWEREVNQKLQEAPAHYDNLKIIDWHSISKNQSKWFYDDHVHPNPTGNKYLAGLVARSMTKTEK
ncbi:acyltransferase family protein [Secundilactobacillus malefermentans]|uniref:acyltransferase family protein n=1 Tax=Secundilactobacillus malefermentans TaxID=176292 RepID=UPI0011CBE2D6|nr:acyltransferase family protein [Secundilactobacillus malefermentans]QEA30805.1 acetyltransferase [Secundilactobacillus malefermentans]